jgi:hypothetical protein
MDLDGGFTAGGRIKGRMRPSQADAEMAKLQEKYTGTPVELFIERIEPMRVFAFRWHPFALDNAIDYSKEPMTLVTFTLEPAEGGTNLTVVESGFDAVPIERRATAFEANEEGWSLMVHVIVKYVQQP